MNAEQFEIMKGQESRKYVTDLYFGYIQNVNTVFAYEGQGPWIPTFNEMGKWLKKLENYIKDGVIPTDD